VTIPQFTEDCTFLETNIDFRIQSESFGFQGKEIIKPGFTKVYPFTVISNSDQIPEVKMNTSCPVLEVCICNLTYRNNNLLIFPDIVIAKYPPFCCCFRKSCMSQKQSHQII